jgi:hypothetical protein
MSVGPISGYADAGLYALNRLTPIGDERVVETMKIGHENIEAESSHAPTKFI